MREKTKVTIILLIVLLLAISDAAAYAEYEKVESAQQSVVRIIVPMQGGYALGTGFVVGYGESSREIIVTNYHVIEDNIGQVQVTATNIYGAVDAKVLYSDPDIDIAILELPEKLENRKTIVLLSPSETHKSQDVYCIGFPGLSDMIKDNSNLSSEIEDMTITKGTISNTNYEWNGIDYIMSDVKVNSGNSGGPMVDEYGQAIGINTVVVGVNDLNNMTLAVSVDYLCETLDELGVVYLKGSPNGKEVVEVDRDKVDIEIPVTVIVVVAALICAALIVGIVIINKRSGNRKWPGKVMLEVRCERGPIKGEMISSRGKIRIGRNVDTCQMVFPSGTPGVSKEHCEIFIENNDIVIRDLNSTYGTILASGERLSGERKNVGSDAIVLLGSEDVIVSVRVV